MNKYTDDILTEALMQLENDESIIDDDNDACIDAVMDDCYGEAVINDEPIF